MSLLGCLEGLLLGLPSHPLAVDEQRDDAEADEENDAEDQNNTWLAARPVASLLDEGKAISLSVFNHGERWHLELKMGGSTLLH